MSDNNEKEEKNVDTTKVEEVEKEEKEEKEVVKKRRKKERKKKKKKYKLTYELIYRGSYGKHAEDYNKAKIIRTREESMQARFKKDIIEGTKWDEQFLLYVGAGEKPTGGYNVSVKRIFIRNGELEVFGRCGFSMRRGVGTLAKTRPYAILRCQIPDFKEIGITENEFFEKKEFMVYYIKKKKKKKKHDDEGGVDEKEGDGEKKKKRKKRKKKKSRKKED